jgi:hypothetical protein
LYAILTQHIRAASAETLPRSPRGQFGPVSKIHKISRFALPGFQDHACWPPFFYAGDAQRPELHATYSGALRPCSAGIFALRQASAFPVPSRLIFAHGGAATNYVWGGCRLQRRYPAPYRSARSLRPTSANNAPPPQTLSLLEDPGSFAGEFRMFSRVGLEASRES